MPEAYIVDALRTPTGRRKGGLSQIHAADLGAHRNSVRYRISRIERDLGIDLSGPEQRMRMWFALSRFPDDTPTHPTQRDISR